jgi:tagatose 6-phosphate kinase
VNTNTDRSVEMILVVCLSSSWQRTLFFPEFSPGKVNRATHRVETASGKGVNVARVAMQLGAKVRILTTAGGTRGKLFRKALKADGVSATIISVSGETRLCQTLIGCSNCPTPLITEIVEESPALSPSEFMAFVSAYSKALRQASLVVLIGTVPTGCGNGCYADFVKQANRLNIPVLVDAQRDLLIQAIREHPSLVKINRAELAEATGTTNLARGVKELAKRGAKRIVISQGARPAMAFDGTCSWKVTPPKINVVNSTGCGDAMMAGIATGLQRGNSLENALKLGVACGAANALTDTAGAIRQSDVNRFLRQN